MPTIALTSLTAGQLVPYGGDRAVVVGAELAAAFREGDRLVAVHDSGDLLHIPADEHALVDDAVGRAVVAFGMLAGVSDAAISAFFDTFAILLERDDSFAPIAAANSADVSVARQRGRSTTRLELSAGMRADMVAGLRVWRDGPASRNTRVATIDHGSWTVATRRAPLGVVGFVFEGRPNVFADAAGVLRTGNTVVFRIGSDALGTARAIMTHAVEPACVASGLPIGAVNLVDSTAHAAGWALFSDRRLALAVARGSGHAVAQLGAVAQQHGVPVSLHGTGGAWLVAAADADTDALEAAVQFSLDRKVCNTLNVCCVEASAADRLVPIVLRAARAAAAARDAELVLHITSSAVEYITGTADVIGDDSLATEWEWENSPEFTLAVVDSVDHAVELFNRYSPRFAASLISDDPTRHQQFYDAIDAPFVGNGFTRWVDGQFAFDQPELGLSNWQFGRLLARGGVLSGDSVHTLRTVAHIRDHTLHR